MCSPGASPGHLLEGSASSGSHAGAVEGTSGT